MGMKIKYNPRKLMELAIEVMRRTVPEPRNKPSSPRSKPSGR